MCGLGVKHTGILVDSLIAPASAVYFVWIRFKFRMGKRVCVCVCVRGKGGVAGLKRYIVAVDGDEHAVRCVCVCVCV